MTKCLIAGLPGAGKTTYIGALAYLLGSPVKNQILSLAENPYDLSYLTMLTQPWLSQKIVDRTTRANTNNTDLKLKSVHNDKTIDISFPDIAGEEFYSIIQMHTDIVRSWSEEPDSLLFFINKWPCHVLAEEFGEKDKTEKSKMPPKFDASLMSEDISNVLLLKELHNLFPWKKLAIGLSSWDEYENSFQSPKKLMQKKAPFLYNFIMHYFPQAMIFGVSAQGAKYTGDKDQIESLMNKTLNGERAYIITENEKSFDLTLPINFLIS